ncbi:GspH/FimT family protein [Hyphobacterium sp. HN65]|uniref:Type II secretion system protein H n=1 Tax=Hyphobacterium lacteum TaxID=3116575 RepID=A0ABU7LNR6_9PROT|nr:GspH/FimT family protein [Hyphobacterium sp. HN65]MEE2525563.1 GspH/FimT family protein [Hyphobacterium sp. HN65]
MRTFSAISSNRKGYTLTELLVVLVVLGLAVALVAPALFRSSPQSRLNNSLAQLEQAARLAQTQARLTGQDTLLQVDLDDRTLTLFPGEESFQLDRAVEIRATVAEHELDGNLASIRFFPEGVTTGGTFLLTLDNRQEALRISWITGRIEEVDPDEFE